MDTVSFQAVGVTTQVFVLIRRVDLLLTWSFPLLKHDMLKEKVLVWMLLHILRPENLLNQD